MAADNILGFSNLLEERIDNEIHSLNESSKSFLKYTPELKAIKSIEWFLEDGEVHLKVNVVFRSGDRVTESFSAYVDKSAIELNSNELEAYFGADKLARVKKYFEDHALDSSYLEAHEPEVFVQLSKLYLLSAAPNTENGAEFTESDKNFFIKIIQKSA